MLLRVIKGLISQGDAPSRGPKHDRKPDEFAARWAAAERLMAEADHRGAVPELQAALTIDPESVAAHNAMGICLATIGRGTESVVHFRRAVALAPEDTASSCNLAAALREVGNSGEARAILARILETHPDDVAARFNLALIEREEGNPAASLARLEGLRGALGDDPHLIANIGKALDELGRHAHAREMLERAVVLRPADPDLRVSLAMHRLATGELGDAWTAYEARHDSHEVPRRDFGLPPWRGEPLAGRRVLVHAEQGIGDEIMFAGCVPDLVAEGADVVLECDPRLAKLFARSFPSVRVHGARRTGSAMPSSLLSNREYQIPIGSLPGRYRTAAANFPMRDRYLRLDARKVDARRAARGGRRMLGIAWRGGVLKTRKAVRSLAGDDLVRLLSVPGVTWVSLQHDATDEELALLRAAGISIEHDRDAFSDFDELGALAAASEGVITVCSSIVHLCGALGLPTTVLTPLMPEWRYGFRGDSMRWYGSVRLERQTILGNWADVIARVHAGLEHDGSTQ